MRLPTVKPRDERAAHPGGALAALRRSSRTPSLFLVGSPAQRAALVLDGPFAETKEWAVNAPLGENGLRIRGEASILAAITQPNGRR